MSTKGTEPLLYEAPVVTILETDYEMRRLGIYDVSRLARILSESGQATMSRVAEGFEQVDKEAVIGAMFGALPEVIEGIVDFLTDLIDFDGDPEDPNEFPLLSESGQATMSRVAEGFEQVDKEAVIGAMFGALPEVIEGIVDFLTDLIDFDGDPEDPNEFPLGSELAIIEQLVEHEDVVAFFGRVLNLAQAESTEKIRAMFSADKSTDLKKPTDGQTNKS